MKKKCALPRVQPTAVVLPEKIERLAVGACKQNPRNARTHKPKQIAQVRASIAEFGFTNPILIDRDNMVVAGHCRLEAARALELAEVPVLRLEHLTPEQLRAYVIADNQLALNAGWDMSILAAELEGLSNLDLGFDITITGFDFPVIDAIYLAAGQIAAGEDTSDQTPEPYSVAVSRAGDIWAIGPHRLICGDSTKADTYAALLGDEKAQMVFADSPYNVPIAGHVSGLGKVKHAEFKMASGEMSRTEFAGFLTTVFGHLADFSADGSIHFQCMDHRHMREMLAAGDTAYQALLNLCVWDKGVGGMGSLWRSQHELIFAFKAGTAPHINNVELGRHGRYRTNVWSYAGANSFSATRAEDLAAHPTVKPQAMVADAILDCSRQHGIILDPFAGSGTTLVAAHRTRRRGYGIELDPIYCDVTLQRLAKAVKIEPILLATGATFAEVKRERAVEPPLVVDEKDAA